MRGRILSLALTVGCSAWTTCGLAWQAQTPPKLDLTGALKRADIEEKLEQEDRAWFNAHHDEIFETLFPDFTVPEYAPWSFQFLAAPSFPNIPRMDLVVWTDSKGMAWARYRAPFIVGILPQIARMRRADPSLTMERVRASFMKEELTLSMKDWPELRNRIQSLQKVSVTPEPRDPFAVTVMMDGAGYRIELKDSINDQIFNLGSGQYAFDDLEFPPSDWGKEHPLIRWAQPLLIELHRRWLKQELERNFSDIPQDSLKMFQQDLFAAAASEGNEAWVRWMLNHGASPNGLADGRPPILAAVEHGSLACIDLLVSRGADLKVDDGVDTVLMVAARNGDIAVAKRLLGLGIDVNAYKGIPPLGLAAANAHLDMVKLLLHHGARTDLKDYTGGTLLGDVRKAEEALKPGDPDPYPAILDLLIKAGAKK